MHPVEHLYGIIGTPLGHSLSPALHNWGFGRLGHPGVFLAWEKQTAELADFFAALRTLPIAGCSVTLPHKTAVIPLLDELTPRAQSAGAVNTVFRRQGRIVGDNTDVAGFLTPLRHLPQPLPRTALILGAGGVSRAVLAGLAELGFCDVRVACRTPAKAEPLHEHFACRIVSWEDRLAALEEMAADGGVLVINATPLGMHGDQVRQSPLPESALSTLARIAGTASLIYDLIYTPQETRLLAEAATHGLGCVSGLDFFLAQAHEQFRLWTGLKLPQTEARALVLAKLKRREK